MKKRLTIGVLTTECYRESISETMQGITAQAFRCGCNVVFLTSLNNFLSPIHERTRLEAELFKLAFSGDLDGFIYDRNYFYSLEIADTIDDILKRSQKPVMLLDGKEDLYFDNTVAHDYEDFERIAEHLINVHGYRNIYCLTGIKGRPQSEERLQAYRAVMKKYGLRCDKSRYSYGDFWTEAPVRLAEKILSGETEKPDAVMCANDVMAQTLIETLQKGGLDVPGDIAVTGFDGYDHERNDFLTTFRKADRRLGAEAVRRLYALMTGKSCKRISDRNDGMLIGESCGCAPIRSRQDRDRRHKMEEIYRERFTYSDMLFDMLAAGSQKELMNVLDGYVRLIYNYKRFRVFLTDGAFGVNAKMRERLYVDTSGEQKAYPKAFSADKLPSVLFGEHKYPAAYFLTLIHDSKNIYGVTALSYGNKEMTYSDVYIGFMNIIGASLSQVGRAADADKASEPGGMLYDRLKDLREKMMSDPEKQWSIEKLCGEVYVSRSYLQRMYKRYFGKSIFEELIEFRISKAKRLLTETDRPIMQLSEECGYSSYNHFVRQFKESEDISPSEYRKKYKR